MSERNLIATQIKALTIFNANNTTMSVESCAKFLKVHPNTIKNRINKNTIIASFQDGKYHIPKLQFLEKLIDKFLINEEKEELSNEEEFSKNMNKWLKEKIKY